MGPSGARGEQASEGSFSDSSGIGCDRLARLGRGAAAASEDVSCAGMTKAHATTRTRPSGKLVGSVRPKNRQPFNSGWSDALC